jgi:hypothetical protein
MIQIIYEKDGIEYDYMRITNKDIAGVMIKILEGRNCTIIRIRDDDQSERNEEVDRKSRGIP